MSVLDQSITKHKMGLLNLADELSNVSQACRVMTRSTASRRPRRVAGWRRYCTRTGVDRISRAAWTMRLSKRFWSSLSAIPLPGRFGCLTNCASKACSSVQRAFAPCGPVRILVFEAYHDVQESICRE